MKKSRFAASCIIFRRTEVVHVEGIYRLIVSALSKERGGSGPEELLNPHVLPEDVGVVSAINEDGIDLIGASSSNFYNGY